MLVSIGVITYAQSEAIGKNSTSFYRPAAQNPSWNLKE
jgi:hypothetical protein